MDIINPCIFYQQSVISEIIPNLLQEPYDIESIYTILSQCFNNKINQVNLLLKNKRFMSILLNLKKGKGSKDRDLHKLKLIKALVSSGNNSIIEAIEEYLSDILILFQKYLLKDNVLTGIVRETLQIIADERIRPLIKAFTTKFKDKIMVMGIEIHFEKIFSIHEKLVNSSSEAFKNLILSSNNSQGNNPHELPTKERENDVEEEFFNNPEESDSQNSENNEEPLIRTEDLKIKEESLRQSLFSSSRKSSDLDEEEGFAFKKMKLEKEEPKPSNEKLQFDFDFHSN